jgi:thiol:disulfide interchange protein DsbC
VKAWSDWMTTNVAPAASPASCDMTTFQKADRAGREVPRARHADHLPELGRAHSGYVPVAQLEKRMANVK